VTGLYAAPPPDPPDRPLPFSPSTVALLEPPPPPPYAFRVLVPAPEGFSVIGAPAMEESPPLVPATSPGPVATAPAPPPPTVIV
jgi:hypothetical protein